MTQRTRQGGAVAKVSWLGAALLTAMPAWASGCAPTPAAAQPEPAAPLVVDVPDPQPAAGAQADEPSSALDDGGSNGQPRTGERERRPQKRWPDPLPTGGPDCEAAAYCCAQISPTVDCDVLRFAPAKRCAEFLHMLRQEATRLGGYCP